MTGGAVGSLLRPEPPGPDWQPLAGPAGAGATGPATPAGSESRSRPELPLAGEAQAVAGRRDRPLGQQSDHTDKSRGRSPSRGLGCGQGARPQPGAGTRPRGPAPPCVESMCAACDGRAQPSGTARYAGMLSQPQQSDDLQVNCRSTIARPGPDTGRSAVLDAGHPSPQRPTRRGRRRKAGLPVRRRPIR